MLQFPLLVNFKMCLYTSLFISFSTCPGFSLVVLPTSLGPLLVGFTPILLLMDPTSQLFLFFQHGPCPTKSRCGVPVEEMLFVVCVYRMGHSGDFGIETRVILFVSELGKGENGGGNLFHSW